MSYKETICNLCEGTGKRNIIYREQCPHCIGTLRNIKPNLPLRPCVRCNGTGKVTYVRKETCVKCDGSGRIYY